MKKLAERLAFWADRLRDISAMGLHFARSSYDKEHYEAVQSIAMEMLAVATSEPLEELEPLRAPVFSRPTPLAVGDAAVIDETGRILLVQRADNKKWAMPGGALEVGETPAEGVVREALEETGIRCQPTALVGVFDSCFCGTLSRHHLYHLVLLCEPLDGGKRSEPSHAQEVLDVGWFREDDLPEEVDPGHISRIPEAYRVWRSERAAFFDE
jgi:ADP-ribose pyrophosphatase YjhB (NUDIX family)